MRRPSLTTWILVAIVAGGAFGYFFPDAATQLRILSTIFIRLIRTIVAPLLFATLVVGIAGARQPEAGRAHGRQGARLLRDRDDAGAAHRMGGDHDQPRRRRHHAAAATAGRADRGAAPQTWQDIVLHVFPENIAKAVADGEVLQIVVFSVMFGVALAHGRRAASAGRC